MESDCLLQPNKWHPWLDVESKSIDTNNAATLTGPDGSIVFENKSSEKICLAFEVTINPVGNNVKGCLISTQGSSKTGTGCLWANKTALPLNGKALIPCGSKTKFNFRFELSAFSEVSIKSVKIEWFTEGCDLLDSCSPSNDVLIVVPDYPTEANLYLSAFAHSRNRRYVQAGLKVQVAAISQNRKSQIVYQLDNVPVIAGGIDCLKALLLKKQYRAIVVHFVDTFHYDIFDGYITTEQLIFICHGPETTFPCLPNVARPYASKPIENPVVDERKVAGVRKYAQKSNVHWVFVSEWLRCKSEELMGASFKNSHIIHNVIDESLFPYREKTAEDRKKILVLRKFDDNRYHSVDIVVKCILELSRRPYFQDLKFEIIGDGSLFTDFTKPLKQFPNINVRRSFVANKDIARLHEACGILLCPSRHESQGVTMCEAASSGLVALGSNVTVNPYFQEDERNHTLCDPEDPVALADLVERFYYNPDEYLAVSKRLSARIRTLCCVSQTIDREIELIASAIAEGPCSWEITSPIKPEGTPILSIIVPAYNLEKFLPKCLYSLLNHDNVAKTEILVVNDGSSDSTIAIARSYEYATQGIVRAIDKENGGHGSTVNVGIAEARGKYLRIVDGDDWVISENLSALVARLSEETADVVLTQGRHEHAANASKTDILRYDMLDDGQIYHFDDLIHPIIGFDTYGPVLSTSTFKTECLRKAKFTLSEKTPYVDMEFNAFSIRYVDTLRFWDLDIYRYYIGREGQSVSREAWKRNHEKHRYVIFNILSQAYAWGDRSDAKLQYVEKHIVAPMVDSQLFMYDQLCLWENIPSFLNNLKAYEGAWQASMNFAKNKSETAGSILKYYQDSIASSSKKPIIGNNKKVSKPKKTSLVKRIVRATLPYGLVRLIQKR